jgi:hypothetical protein
MDQTLIKDFYSFMEKELEGFKIYTDTPEKRFEYKLPDEATLITNTLPTVTLDIPETKVLKVSAKSLAAG